MTLTIASSLAHSSVAVPLSDQPPDTPTIEVWQQLDGVSAATLSDCQLRQHHHCAGSLQMTHAVTHHCALQLPDIPPEQAQAGGWWRWTSALLAAKAAEGGLETFIGRLAQESVLALGGRADEPASVSDGMLAAHAAINIATGTLTAARAALHCWRATSQPQAYFSGLRGEPASSLTPGAFIAGTPQQPVGQLARVAAAATAGLATFAVASHSGWIALSHLGDASTAKDDAWHAVLASNANASYVWTRELVHRVLQQTGLVCHQALLTPAGAAASSAQYLANSLLQQTASSALQISKGGEFDLRWPILSAAAEAIDVSFIAGAARFAAPQMPVDLFRGRWRESDADRPPGTPANFFSLQTLDRLSQRAAGREMVTQVARIMPFEAGQALRGTAGDSAPAIAAWAGAILGSATHLREPLWQAENAASAAPTLRP